MSQRSGAGGAHHARPFYPRPRRGPARRLRTAVLRSHHGGAGPCAGPQRPAPAAHLRYGARDPFPAGPGVPRRRPAELTGPVGSRRGGRAASGPAVCRQAAPSARRCGLPPRGAGAPGCVPGSGLRPTALSEVLGAPRTSVFCCPFGFLAELLGPAPALRIAVRGELGLRVGSFV